MLPLQCNAARVQRVEEVHFVVYSPTERVERILGKVEPLEFYAMCWRRHNKASLARPCQLLAGFGLVRMMMMVMMMTTMMMMMILGAMTAVYNFTDGLRFHFRSVILLLCSSFAKNISFFLAYLSFVTFMSFSYFIVDISYIRNVLFSVPAYSAVFC